MGEILHQLHRVQKVIQGDLHHRTIYRQGSQLSRQVVNFGDTFPFPLYTLTLLSV